MTKICCGSSLSPPDKNATMGEAMTTHFIVHDKKDTVGVIVVGDTLLKYGHDIGKAVALIGKGRHAHVHNVKTKRW